MIRRILVVCVGNLCRSPMAEVLFRHCLPDVKVSSAGLAAWSGEPMASHALDVLAAHDLKGDHHVARQLYDALIRQADLIVCMEHDQVDALKRHAPHAADRIFLLDHWLQREDIPDPFRQSRAAFESAYDAIDRAVRSWLPHIRPG